MIKTGCVTVIGVAAALALAFGLALLVGLARLPLMNLERQVTTHSQGYVQAHQQILLASYADWQRATDDPHKLAAVTSVCADAALLDKSEWPAQVAPFIAINCH